MKFITIVVIIKRNLVILLYRFIGKTDKIIPYKVLINLTNNCNSRCKFCNIWKINKENPELLKNEITLNHIVNVFKDLNKNLLWLALSGGEVTLVPYYKDMILTAKKYCPNLKILTFTTNAINPQKAVEYALFAIKQGFDVFITISLDGGEELHDKLRGISGNYKSAWGAYKLLKNNNVNCHFGLTVSDQNSEFIQSRHYYKMKKEIRAITFVHNGGIYNKETYINYDKIYDALKIIYRNYKVYHLSELIEKIHIKISLFFIKRKTEKNIIPCEVMNTSVHIMANGEIKPCMFVSSLGNIKNDKISYLYKSEKGNLMRTFIKKGSCQHCWINCYSPHSIMQHPIKSLLYLFKKP